MNTLTMATSQHERSFFTYARVLATQLLYLTPVFWLLELAQNQLFRAIQGEWGWIYPASPYRWFSFGSLMLWAGAIWLLWTLHYCWFRPKRLGFWRRVAWGTAFTWSGEWLAGFLAAKVFGTPMQVWPGSPLVYVSFGAIFFWVSNVIVYHLLTVNAADVMPKD